MAGFLLMVVLSCPSPPDSVMAAYRHDPAIREQANWGTWLQVYDTTGRFLHTLFPVPDAIRSLGWRGGFRVYIAPVGLNRVWAVFSNGWVVARPERPETSLWLRSMNFPFPVQTISPSRALPLLEGMLGGNPWTHMPALILVYHGKALAIQSFSSINLEGIHWLERYLQNRERFPWFF